MPPFGISGSSASWLPGSRLPWRRAAGLAVLLLGGLSPGLGVRAAPVPAGTEQQFQGSAKKSGQAPVEQQQRASPQAEERAETIGQSGSMAPVGLPPGQRGTGAVVWKPTPHAPPGKKIVPGSENPAGPFGPTRDTAFGAATAESGPTGGADSSPSRSHVVLPGTGTGTGGEAATGPGTKLSKKALPLPQPNAAAQNGYNPAHLAPAGATAPQSSSGSAQGYHPSQVAGIGQGGKPQAGAAGMNAQRGHPAPSTSVPSGSTTRHALMASGPGYHPLQVSGVGSARPTSRPEHTPPAGSVSSGAASSQDGYNPAATKGVQSGG